MKTRFSTIKPKIFHFNLSIILIAILVSACHEQPDPVVVTQELTPTSETIITPRNPPPKPTEIATPQPISLFLSYNLPEKSIDFEALGDVVFSDDPAASLWFGPEFEAPPGDILYCSNWIFALAAPFPTLVDNIILSDLQAYWLGTPQGELKAVTKLYVPETLAQALEGEWGPTDLALIERYQEPFLNEMLWESGAWAILPFESLSPKLKVISVGGESPLLKDFKADTYPLVVEFHLVANQHAITQIQDNDLTTFIQAIRPSNRNPENMTTLIMTGVTALVRGIAYRMELYGVRYPGEEIRDWLVEADLTHISNEVSFYEDCPYPDPSSRVLLFCSDPKYIDLLDYVGADIIELTGNHNNDALYMYGDDAVPFTLNLYETYGMSYFGGGRNLAAAKSPLLVTHNGNRLAFIGCNAFGPDFAWATEEAGGAAPCEDYQWMADEISRLRDEGYLPIATFQYYEDYYDFAAEHHIRDFGLVAEAGAVIVNGSQAHRPKAMDFRYDAFIDYGLGNLFFDQKWVIDMYGNVIHQTSWEIIQRHTFYEGRHLSTELLTAILEDFAQPRPMTIEERQLFLSELFTASGWISR